MSCWSQAGKCYYLRYLYGSLGRRYTTESGTSERSLSYLRKNQKAIQRDMCDQWFHVKCTGMKVSEYDQLCDSTKAWQCMKCLFPGFDTPVRCSHKISTADEAKENEVPESMVINPNLKKRGMKFAHVNIVTLPGHSADVDVLLEKANLDLLGVTESRLDSTISDSQICPDGYTCYRKDRNRNGGGCALFV